MNIILYAIPFFLFAIIIELIVDRYRGTGFYQFNDAINSLNLGILSRVVGLLTATIPFSLYFLLYENAAIFTLPQDKIWVTILAFVLYDLAYYWVHRLNHRVSVMWGSHVVHHSSEEYNLTTALRQTSTPSVFAWIIVLPLACVGISPGLLLACASLNLVYQFWVHTRHIDKMPAWYEAIFVTPSHHRVHHALNREYIDKNFGGVWIIWDKLFGSFQAEKVALKTVYGVSQQLKSWNPIWANIQVYGLLAQDAWRTKGWRNKMSVWLKPPGWRPVDVTQQYPRQYVTTKTMKERKFDVAISVQRKRYVLCQYLVFLLCTVGLLLVAKISPLWVNATLCAVAALNLFVIGMLQAKTRYSLLAESGRVVITTVIVNWQLIEHQFISAVPMTLLASLTYIGISLGYMCLNLRVAETTGGVSQSATTQ